MNNHGVFLFCYTLNMSDKSGVFIRVLEAHYGIKGEADDIYETFELGFEKQRFRVNDKRYNLVHCTKNFPLDKKLISQMTNSEMITIKSYDLVEQLHPLKDFYLYELIPYTVQGIPDW